MTTCISGTSKLYDLTTGRDGESEGSGDVRDFARKRDEKRDFISNKLAQVWISMDFL